MIRIIVPARDITKDLQPLLTQMVGANSWEERWNAIKERIDFNIGMTTTEGQEHNPLKSDTFVFAGLSYEINKYFDLAAGYAVTNTGKASTGYVGVSLDLALFDDLYKGLVPRLAGRE